MLAIACDGAGSVTHSRQGALVTARTLVRCARIHFSMNDELPTDEEFWDWLDLARDRISRAASARDLNPKQFACTLVSCIASPTGTLVAHIGDGACVVQIDGEWRAASWPESGEYASTTFFVTDSPAPRLRLTRLPVIDAVALFTDGIERLVLDFGKKTAHAPWFDRFIKPVISAGLHGRNPGLSKALHSYLESPSVVAHSDDDKTLILAARV